MAIYNIMENFVLEIIDSVLKTKPDICTCEKCRDDIAALALNKLKPRYVSSRMGDLFTRTELMDSKLRTAIVVNIAEAAEKVAVQPRHERDV